MVNVTLTESHDTLVFLQDGTPVLYNAGDMSWILTSSALVALMTFGIGYLYSGLLRRKNALSMIWLSAATFAVICCQWFLIGYSLAFSESGSSFMGNLRHFGLMGVLEEPSVGRSIPRILHCLYQLTFATITPCIAIGAVAERGRLGPTLFFVFAWATLVYDPIAYWSWSVNGWAAKWGVLDFAGGGVVHLSSGTAACAYAYWLGKRTGYGSAEVAYRPNSVSNVVLGTVFLLIGWQGFNAGSALAANLRAAMAGFCTFLAASSAGLTWCLMDLRFEGKWSSVSFCTGCVTGLIAVTPASGFVGAPAAFGIGIITAVVCNLATSLKFYLRFDDTLDVWATHAVGGFVGNLLTGIFADKRIAAIDGTVISGGAINGHGIQLAKQLAYSGAVAGYTFAMTSVILLVMDRIPLLSLRVSATAERDGIDITEMNEIAVDTTSDIKSPMPTHSPNPNPQTVQGIQVRSTSHSTPITPDNASMHSFERKGYV